MKWNCKVWLTRTEFEEMLGMRLGFPRSDQQSYFLETGLPQEAELMISQLAGLVRVTPSIGDL